MRRLHSVASAGLAFLVFLAIALGQQSAVKQSSTDAAGRQPRKEPSGDAVSVEGLIRLDVTVTDQAGKSVAGLRRSDFRLLDNGEPQKVVAFRAPNSVPAGSDNMLSVILILDTLNVPSDIALLERYQAAQFLRQNSRKFARPVTVYSLEDSGFFLVATPSTDGGALAKDVAFDKKVEAYFVAPHAQLPFKAPVDNSLEHFPPAAELRALANVATMEVSTPGRKLLLWIGPRQSDLGTTLPPPSYSTSGKHGDKVKRDLFQKMCWLSTLLRQARVTLDDFSSGNGEPVADIRTQVLAGIPSADQASWLSPLKEILAVQSGGQVLSSTKGLAGRMNDAIDKAGTAYSLTFDPPLAVRADEYHSLKVELTKPGLTASTSTGYYDQPFYSDPPDPEIRKLTVAQLEEMLKAPHSEKALEQELLHVVLSERLSHTMLQPLLAEAHGKKNRESLEMIADESTFLDPPSTGSSSDPPDKAAQQRMLNAAADYLSRVIPRLPNFFASRTAINYSELAPYPGVSETATSEPLHVERQSKDTVLYRRGEEILRNAKAGAPAGGESLRTYGTFGPILSLVQAALKLPGAVTWERWENGAGARAVFHLKLAGTPTFYLSGCCYPNGLADARVEFSSNANGELVIDPHSGAILRVQTESELPGFVFTKRSDMMVSYGPAQIGGKTYIVPLRSVNIWRSRSLATLPQWNVGFSTWGPYETRMNVFAFDHYHLFRGDVRILPGFNQVSDK